MKLGYIDHGAAFDWGRASEDYARYRDIYPKEFYRKIVELGLCTRGQDVLDLGTGTGVLPRNLYRYGARFTGVDAAEGQIAQARRLSQGMDITYIVAAAEDLEFPDGFFDVVTACQCMQYFDTAVLAPKLSRMLRDDGHLCILFMAWLPEEDVTARRSEELVLRYNPVWTGAGIRRAIPEFPEWAKGLFRPEHLFSYDASLPFTRESWHGRIRACRGVGASSLPRAAIAAFEKEHRAFLQSLPEPFEVLHQISVTVLRKV